MKILHKTLVKKWFEMIKSGVKKEEYLEIKPYWINRLVLDADYPTNGQKEDFIDGYGQPYVVTKFKPFDIVSANNGYQKDCPCNILFNFLCYLPFRKAGFCLE